MNDAVGQFQRLSQALFGLLAFRDVLDLCDEVQGLAFGVMQQRACELDPHAVAVLPDVAFFHLVERNVACKQSPRIVEVRFDVLRMGDFLGRQLFELILFIADNLAKRLIDLQEMPFQGDGRQAYGGVFQDVPDVRLVFPQCALHLLSPGDVARHAAIADQISGRIREGQRTGLDNHDMPVAMDALGLDLIERRAQSGK